MIATAGAPSLSGLVETINHECRLIAQAEASALEHAIGAGHALTRAKALVPGSWLDWVAVNLDVHHSSATLYMRVARYENVVREQGATSIMHAREILRHLPRVSTGQPRKQLDEGVLKQVRNGEISMRAAARTLGVTDVTVKRRIDPTLRRGGRQGTPEQQRSANRRARAARAALREKEQERAVRRGGSKPVSEAYALVRRSLQLLDQAMGETENKEVKAHLATATRRLHGAEDEIVRASRLG